MCCLPFVPVSAGTFFHSLRLQPLVDFRSGRTVAHEALIAIPNVNLEALFAVMPARCALQLFFRQAATLLRMPGKAQFWLNLPAQNLLDEEAIDLLLAFRHQQRLTIEIQDPLAIVRMSGEQQRRLYHPLRQLKAAGWKIWLDDLTREMADEYRRLALPLDGVKIDRSELNAHPQFAPFIQLVKANIASAIVIEGIETTADLERACASGARFGQGFLWPERRIGPA